jgi:hypothetical protein
VIGTKNAVVYSQWISLRASSLHVSRLIQVSWRGGEAACGGNGGDGLGVPRGCRGGVGVSRGWAGEGVLSGHVSRPGVVVAWVMGESRGG